MCVDEAETLGVPMVAGALVRQMLAITNARYGPDSDFTSIAKAPALLPIAVLVGVDPGGFGAMC